MPAKKLRIYRQVLWSIGLPYRRIYIFRLLCQEETDCYGRNLRETRDYAVWLNALRCIAICMQYTHTHRHIVAFKEWRKSNIRQRMQSILENWTFKDCTYIKRETDLKKSKIPKTSSKNQTTSRIGFGKIEQNLRLISFSIDFSMLTFCRIILSRVDVIIIIIPIIIGTRPKYISC